MMKLVKVAVVTISMLILSAPQIAHAHRGIYLTQYTLENTAFLEYLIKRSRASGIDTFVVDMERPSKRYRDNLAILRFHHIRYVARIVMFPEGGTADKIRNPEVWQRKFGLVKQAVDWGAAHIQLDYIRYNTKQKPSAENAKDILTIIQWYKNKLASYNVPLQIDVFGETSFGESKWIGQNVQLFAASVDVVCPMVYPSHYQPYAKHYQTPFATVYDSLKRLKLQFGNKIPFKLFPYIELSNYHYPMSREKKWNYVKAQLKAVQAAGADGWYAWSPHNRYEVLFDVLEN